MKLVVKTREKDIKPVCMILENEACCEDKENDIVLEKTFVFRQKIFKKSLW